MPNSTAKAKKVVVYWLTMKKLDRIDGLFILSSVNEVIY